MKPIIAVPVITAMLYRAWSHNSLTPAGLVVAGLTAVAHAIHPWNLPIVLLAVFFLAGTRVTKIKQDVKAKLTMQSTGSSGGEGARTHVQVFANSGIASVFCLVHAFQLHQRSQSSFLSVPACYKWKGDLLVVGIIANYAAVAADTFSSELGILSKSHPRLITSWNLRKVPPGTNGGVTLYGILAGLLGSLIVVTATMFFVPFCPQTTTIPGLSSHEGWGFKERMRFTYAMTLWGALGSLLDSFLGGWLQQSVVDTRSGRIVEGEGGRKVLVSKDGKNSMHYRRRAGIKAALLNGEGKEGVEQTGAVEETLDEKMGGGDPYDPKKKFRTPSFGDEQPSRKVESGLGLLDNNGVNMLMAATMSVGAMVIASWFWEVPFNSVLI